MTRRLALFLCGAAISLGPIARSDAGGSPADSPESAPGATARARTASDVDSKPSGTRVKAKTETQDLVGRDAGEVESELGKPGGKLQTARGALWLYAEWRVQFDPQGRVLSVEKDAPVRLARIDPQFVAASEALSKAAAARTAADDAARAKAAKPAVEKIRIISNQGQTVELPSLLPDSKVTIVDFYADWCGPCRRLGPLLEQLVSEDPDVVLLKIDIIDWKSPVCRQFQIKSVPNVRVFNPAGAQVGEATSDLDVVKEQVLQARKRA